MHNSNQTDPLGSYWIHFQIKHLALEADRRSGYGFLKERSDFSFHVF